MKSLLIKVSFAFLYNNFYYAYKLWQIITLLFCTAGKPGRRGRPPKKKKRDSDEDDDDDDDDDFFNRVETEDVLEDGVEWFEEDKCASGECKRPKGKRVAWVRSQASKFQCLVA